MVPCMPKNTTSYVHKLGKDQLPFNMVISSALQALLLRRFRSKHLQTHHSISKGHSRGQPLFSNASPFDPKCSHLQPIHLNKKGSAAGSMAHTKRALFPMQELQALIKYIQLNKQTDSDWFTVTSNKDGTHWSGKCWYVHELIKYEFDWQFDIPATYPTTAPEIEIPELDGKTAKMYRGGKICLTVHFKPLWAKNRYTVCQHCTRSQ